MKKIHQKNALTEYYKIKPSQYIKGITHHHQGGFILGIQDLPTSKHQMMKYTKLLEDKNHMIIFMRRKII